MIILEPFFLLARFSLATLWRLERVYHYAYTFGRISCSKIYDGAYQLIA